MNDRPPIPEQMKRAVRQRCGYGCVLCGIPVFHYDHMIEYAQVHVHEADNLTLLCPTHHGEKTVGRLPLRDVQEANENPFNLRTGQTSPHPLRFSDSFVEVGVGTNYFQVQLSEGRGDVAVLAVDRSHLLGFSFEDGYPLLNLVTRNRDNRKLLRVQRGEMSLNVTGLWDFTFMGTKLVLRSANRVIDLVIWYDPEDSYLWVRRGNLRLNRVEFRIGIEGDLHCVNSGKVFRHCRFGQNNCIHVGPPETVRPGYLSLGDVTRTINAD